MPGKFYRLYKKEGVGPRVSQDGVIRESYSSTEFEEDGVTERELVVNRLADCGCLVSDHEIAVCSCGRVICLRHSIVCGGNIVCLQCCPAQGKPDFFVCLSCRVKNSLKRLASGRRKDSDKLIARGNRNGDV